MNFSDLILQRTLTLHSLNLNLITMRKRLFYFLFGFAIVAGFISCNKNTDIRRNPTPSNPPTPGTTTNLDEQASAVFNASIQATVDNSFSELFTNAYQSTEEFVTLADASAVILQRAGLLSGYMDELTITHYNDPRLILAAKIINDLYVEGPPPVDNINNANNWTCLLATLNVPGEAVVDVMKGKSMAEIGTIVEAMGARWLIKQLVKVGHEGVAGWGAGIGLTEFSGCMLTGVAEPWQLDEVNFQWPAGISITFTTEQLETIIAAALPWYDANNADWPVDWTPATILEICNSFKTVTLSGNFSSTQSYMGYYLCIEPGFMDQLAIYINSPGYIMPNHP
jgi:hypothetical protein